VTYLNHNHRESEDVRFLTVRPSEQDLWGSPSRGVALLIRGALHGIQVLSHRGDAEIHDARTARLVHENIRLIGCEYDCRTGFRTTTYSLEVPMDHIAGVEVAEAISDVR